MESIVLTIIILAIGFIGGYAVLRKTVHDLKKSNEEKLDKDKHDDLCKIASFEMKDVMKNTMKDTLDEFKEDVFQPAMKQLLNAINGGKT